CYMKLTNMLFVIAIAASAQTSSNVQTFGMVGIAGGETARLNVLNVGGQGQASQCIASLIFVDDQGAVLKTNTLALSAGRSMSLGLAADTDLGRGASERRQIRAVVAPIPAVAPQGAPACALAPTLEIFDRSTGRTSILMANTTPIPQSTAHAIQPAVQ